MIAACPKCAARYRVDVARLRPEGARLRCTRCEAIFRVSPPKQAESEPQRPAPAESRPAVPQSAPAPVAPPTDSGGRRVLIADPEVEAGKSNAQTLASWGLDPLLVHDGVDAILTIQRTLPRAVVLDAALPKMFGFQICELMKRNDSLRSIHVVLVGAIHDRDRYRRPPNEIYGADAYVERHQLPDALRPILEGFGLLVPESAASPTTRPPAPAPPVQRPPEEPPDIEPPPARETPRAAAPPAAPPQVSQPSPAAPAARSVEPGGAAEGAGAPSDDPEVQKAERLARIVVSDIVLYNEEKFASAVAAGNVLEVMESDLGEGRELFRQRIDERVRESRDFLAEELVRVARQRGMK